MDGKVDIEDLGKKIVLLLRSDISEVKTLEEMLRRVGLKKDTWSRIRGGTRILTDDRFVSICECFGVPQQLFFSPLLEFGARLGFSRRQVAEITLTPIPGIDFMSRIRDSERVRALFAILEGFWESYYYSVSREDRILVSRDVLWVKRVNEDDFIEVELDDTHFRYDGWCIPISGQLYFVMEKVKLLNEIIVYATNYPDRTPPLLFGVILCTSGGVKNRAAYPSAAKVAFRFIGTKESLAERYNLRDERATFEKVTSEYARYIDPSDKSLDVDTRSLIAEISNGIPSDAVPFALRMEDSH
jgi:transcriptional regulator with XRE-family HTH domain